MKDDDLIDGLPYNIGNTQFNIVKSMYQSAYIDAAFDGGGDPSFNTDDIPFKININTIYEVEGFYSNNLTSIAGSKNLESEKYWVSNILLGWQGETNNDHDPKDESYIDLGLTPLPINEIHCNVANGSNISYICVEDFNDFFGSDLKESMIGYAIAHEIGHQFGLTHGFKEGANYNTDCASCIGNPCNHVGLMSFSLEENDAIKGFIPLHIDLLRSRINPPRKN